MIIGPEPIKRIFFKSSRRGTAVTVPGKEESPFLGTKFPEFNQPDSTLTRGRPGRRDREPQGNKPSPKNSECVRPEAGIQRQHAGPPASDRLCLMFRQPENRAR